MKKRILSILFLLFVCYHVQAQELINTASLKVYFQAGSSIPEVAYCDNSALIQKVRALQLDTLCHVRKIRIVSGASPEGDTVKNKQLAAMRAKQTYLDMKRFTSLNDTVFDVSSVGTNWQGLTELVEASKMPYRSGVLHILCHTPEWITRNGVVVDGRKHQLQLLCSGKAWFYMVEHFFPELRNSEIRVTCEIERMPTAVLTPVVKPEPVAEPQPMVQIPERKPFYMALKTNLLYDALLVPNIGAEFYVGRGWSVGGSWMYSWWNSDKRRNYWRTCGGEFNLRKYLGRKATEQPLTGHHFGLYLQGSTYDFEVGGTGSQSKFSYGAGIEYGYSLPIGRRLNLDFAIDAGYLGGEYKTYTSEDTHYVWKETKQRHWFGPTKAEISLVWLLGRGNYNVKKRTK